MAIDWRQANYSKAIAPPYSPLVSNIFTSPLIWFYRAIRRRVSILDLIVP